MARQNADDLQPFVEKKLRLAAKRGFIIVTVFAPTKRGKRFVCKYQFSQKGEVVRSSNVTGADAVHALLLAFWKIEIELRHKMPFRDLKIEHDRDSGYGFVHEKSVWDSVYPSS